MEKINTNQKVEKPVSPQESESKEKDSVAETAAAPEQYAAVLKKYADIIHSKDSKVRFGAAFDSDDAELLEYFARRDPDLLVRKTAIRRGLIRLEVVEDLAKNDTEWSIRYEAVMTGQLGKDILEGIAKNDLHGLVRLGVVQSDQLGDDTLEHIARKDSNLRVRIEAARRMQVDQDTLKEIVYDISTSLRHIAGKQDVIKPLLDVLDGHELLKIVDRMESAEMFEDIKKYTSSQKSKSKKEVHDNAAGSSAVSAETAAHETAETAAPEQEEGIRSDVPEEFAHIVNNKDKEVRMKAAQESDNPELLDFLIIHDKESHVRQYAINNKNSRPETVDSCADDPDDAVRCAVAGRIKNKDILKRMAKKGLNPNVRIMAIMNKHIELDVVDSCMNDSNMRVLKAVARKTKNDDVHRHFANSRDANIRELAARTARNRSILEPLTKDPDREVCRIAAKRMEELKQ